MHPPERTIAASPPARSAPAPSPSQIRDLLAKNPNTRLEMKESPDSGVYVKDLTCFVVKSVPEIRKVLEARAVALRGPQEG